MTDDYLLLMADTDKITDNVIFLYFKKFLTCSLCKPEGIKAQMSWVMVNDLCSVARRFVVMKQQSELKTCKRVTVTRCAALNRDETDARCLTP